VARDGNFDGTIHAELDPGYLTRLFAEAAPIAHDVLLVQAEGEVLGGPEPRRQRWQVSADDPLMSHITAQPLGGSFTEGAALGSQNERLYSYEQVPGYPVWVAIAVDRVEILRRWYASLTAYGAAASASSLALLLASWAAVRRARSELVTYDHQMRSEIADRLRAEEMLRQSQKLEAMGQLTGGIAHDFNNLLGVIVGNVEFLLDAVQDKPEQVELAREILYSALNGAELTHSLLAFARKQPLEPQLIDLNALLPSNVAMLRRTLGHTIRVTATLAQHLWLTHADPSQVGNVLLNLALNARDAMPEGGGLTIGTTNFHQDALSLADKTEISEGDYVVLTVTDTGTGMSPEVIARATEPFFTTKPPTFGSGLGLSMTYGFAKQSGGHIKIDSHLGIGTTISLYLPRAQDNTTSMMERPAAQLAGAGKNEVILLVDDNPTLRTVTQRHLVALGYNVIEAESGPAALAILESGETVSLLLTDVVMPEGMSGYDLAKAAQLLRPSLKVLFTTGYTAAWSTNGDTKGNRQRTLHKPYQQHDLANEVRAILDEHDSAFDVPM
jgi:signal transduction histidine kinase/CheY-like chemotaxis protein